MAYATSLENFMRQEVRNFDMCVVHGSYSIYFLLCVYNTTVCTYSSFILRGILNFSNEVNFIYLYMISPLKINPVFLEVKKVNY